MFVYVCVLQCCDVCLTMCAAIQQRAAAVTVTVMWRRTVAAVLVAVIVSTTSAQDYSSQWAVHIEGGPQQADAVADRNGFVNLGQVSQSASIICTYCVHNGHMGVVLHLMNNPSCFVDSL